MLPPLGHVQVGRYGNNVGEQIAEGLFGVMAGFEEQLGSIEVAGGIQKCRKGAALDFVFDALGQLARSGRESPEAALRLEYFGLKSRLKGLAEFRTEALE